MYRAYPDAFLIVLKDCIYTIIAEAVKVIGRVFIVFYEVTVTVGRKFIYTLTFGSQPDIFVAVFDNAICNTFYRFAKFNMPVTTEVSFLGQRLIVDKNLSAFCRYPQVPLTVFEDTSYIVIDCRVDIRVYGNGLVNIIAEDNFL